MGEQAVWAEGRLFAPACPNAEERRAETRMAVPRAGALLEIAGGAEAPRRGELRDVSAFGAGLVVPGPVPTRALLQVRFQRAGAPLLARVAHATPVPGGWLAGCAFVAELDDEGLRPFQASRVPAPAGDARRWVRFPCGVSARVVPPDGGEHVPARVVDASAGGLGLALPRNFRPGTVLGLVPPGAAAPLPLRVVRSERAAGGWFLGCEFAGRLARTDLDALCRAGQALGPRSTRG